MLSLIFLITALVLFIIAAIGIPTARFNLIAAGLAFLTAYLLVAGKLLV